MIQKYPARAHALKAVNALSKLIPEADRDQLHAIFVQAAPVMFRHDTDRELPYHQEANFSYLTGCPTASASVLIIFDCSAGTTFNVKHHLLVPHADPAETMWSVAPPTLEESKAQFDSDHVTYVSSLKETLEGAVAQAKETSRRGLIIHTLPNTLDFPALPAVLLDSFDGDAPVAELHTEHLLESLHIARLTKDEFEIDLIRKANQITSEAHEVLMREMGKFAQRRAEGSSEGLLRSGKDSVEAWEVESEGDAEALFVAVCKRAGASQAYLPIVASGSRASTLHYVCNDRLFPSTSIPRQRGDDSFTPQSLQRGCCGADDQLHEHLSFHNSSFKPQVLLIDAGCEWKDYASDVTRVLPIGNGGKFVKQAGEIYDIVLKMQKECEALVKPGVHWDTLHLRAHTVLVEEFIELGIFEGTAEEILLSGVTAAFLPHGLGHSLGLDVHDSRQYLKSTHIDIPATPYPSKLFTYLRIRRPLEPGMVLTVEPGCYFPPQLMDEHGVWSSPFVVKEKLKEYVSVGGVRLEDVIVVREGKCENLTTIGRERSWVEHVCSGQK